MRAKHSTQRTRMIRRRRLALALVAAMAAPAAAQNLPEAGNVVSGTATINPGGLTMTINQSTRGAIIDWGSFSIGAGYGVDFQNGTGVTLNRVIGFGYGPSASFIDGSLTSTGTVFLVNRAGITFGSGAQVNVGGLIASTMDISNADFNTGVSSGRYAFEFTAPGADVNSIFNSADITTSPGGTVGFIGSVLTNTGTINAPAGSVVFGSGQQVTLDFFGDGLTQVTISGNGVLDQAPIGCEFSCASVPGIASNSGTISADGGQILMRVAAVPGNTAPAIINTGTLRAQGMVNRAGRIELTAPGGTVSIGGFPDGFQPGVIDVSGGSFSGGSVLLAGNAVGVLSDPSNPANASRIDASGGAGGGSVDILATDAAYLLAGATINADATNAGDGGFVRIVGGNDVGVLGNITANAGPAGGNGGSIGLGAFSGDVLVTGALDANGSGSGNGGTVAILAPSGTAATNGAIRVDGGVSGGSVQIRGADILVTEVSTISANGTTGSGGNIVVAGSSQLAAFGSLSARGGAAGGTVLTSTGGTFDIRGLGVDAGSAGAAGTWTLWAPNIDVVDGAASGSLRDIALGDEVQDAEINRALDNGTNVTLRAGVTGTGGEVYFNPGVEIDYATGSAPLTLRVDADGGIAGNDFRIGATSGALSMIFNSDASNLNNGFGGISFSSATLSSNGGDISLFGQSDPGAGYASSYDTGIRLTDSSIDSGAGNVLLRGASTGSDAGTDDAGVVLDGTMIATTSGDVTIDGVGEGVTGGVALRNGSIVTGTGTVAIAGAGAAGAGIQLASNDITTGGGGIGLDGVSNAGPGISASDSRLASVGGAITLIGIGAQVGVTLAGSELSTDSGHLDLRGRGIGSSSTGLVIGRDVRIATNVGGIQLSGEGVGGAGVLLEAGSSVDAGNSLVVLRAGNDGSSDAVRIGGSISSLLGVNLRPGGVDVNGGLTERTGDEVLVGGGTTGFALSGDELALIEAPELIIGSNLHAGAIRVLGMTTRNGNLTLQNDGGGGGIDLQAAVDVGSGTLALSSGGSITQTSAGAITAHSLLARADGDVLLAVAGNNVAATTLAGSAGGDFQFQDVDALAIGNVTAVGFDATVGGLSGFGANGITAGGDVFVRNLAGDLTLKAGVSATNIDLVTAGRLQNVAGASLDASGDWRVWANTWEGETRGGLAGSGNLPNLYGCAYLGACGVTVPGDDNHFIYVQQPTALVTFDSFSREYGLPNPLFTFSVTGAILGDTAANVASGSATTTATIGSDVGNYAISGSFLSAAGYRIQFVPGNLAITPATLLFTADNFVRYLGTVNPTLTGSVTGFRNDDTLQSVFGSGVIWSTPAGLLSPIGYYPVNGGTTARNYVFSQAPGNATALRIIPLPQLPSTPIDYIRETVNTYLYDRNIGGAPVCAINASMADQQLASAGDELSNEWSKVRSRPNLTNCFESERKNSCGDF